MKTTIKKAQTGTYMASSKGTLNRSKPKMGDVMESESIDTSGYQYGKNNFLKKTSSSNRVTGTENIKRSDVSSVISNLKKDASRKEDYRTPLQKSKAKLKTGGKVMMKRADGSSSPKGLYDNIRAAAKKNKASGTTPKKPSTQMLKQERKIKNSKK